VALQPRQPFLKAVNSFVRHGVWLMRRA
jgi:hypothetical protein